MNSSAADGACPGMAPPTAGRHALADGAAGSPPHSTNGTVALGHTECDVVRGIGVRPTMSVSPAIRAGDRVAVVDYSVASGRHLHLHRGTPVIDRARAEPAAPAGAAKPKKRCERGCAPSGCNSMLHESLTRFLRKVHPRRQGRAFDPKLIGSDLFSHGPQPARFVVSSSWPPAIRPRPAAAHRRAARAFVSAPPVRDRA